MESLPWVDDDFNKKWDNSLHLSDTTYFKAPRQNCLLLSYSANLLTCLLENVFCSKAAEIDNVLHKNMSNSIVQDPLGLPKEVLLSDKNNVDSGPKEISGMKVKIENTSKMNGLKICMAFIWKKQNDICILWVHRQPLYNWLYQFLSLHTCYIYPRIVKVLKSHRDTVITIGVAHYRHNRSEPMLQFQKVIF